MNYSFFKGDATAMENRSNEVSFKKVLAGQDQRTTLMIKNIPVKIGQS
jgi:hypothetical protein